jgi:DNA-binding CsgD family transcriptional regulator
MTVFVGRVDELAALGEVADTAVRGQVAAALVVGDPGSGKSRLLAETAARIRMLKLFRVVGYEPESDVPLAAASDLLRDLAGAGPHGRRLDRLLLGHAEDASSPLEPVRIFEAAHRALRAAGPAIVLVDDVQWVDELSMALCHYLVRAADANVQSLALIAVARPSPNATSLSESLSHLLAPERVRRLELGPLESDEAIALAKALAPKAGDETARAFAAKSRGSPFWLEALARSDGAEIDAGRLVTVRLRGAGADAAALVALLAVAARPLTLAGTATLAEWEPARAEQAARELVARGVAVESAGMLRLAHDLIRAAATAEIGDDRRRELHKRLGDWLARIAGSDVRRLREAVGHIHAAGDQPVELANRLVQSPQRTLLGTEGLRLLASIADEADPLDSDALTLEEGIATLAAELGEHEHALERWSRVAERAELPEERATALLAASRAAYGLGRGEEARDLLEQSRRIDTADDVLRLEQTAQDAAILLWLELRTAQGRAVAREAVSEATRLAEAAGGVQALDARTLRVYVEVLRLESEAAVIEADPVAMLQAAEAREAAARHVDLESFLTAAIAVCLALRENGRLAEAVARGRRVWNEAQRHVFPRLLVDAGFLHSRALMQQGDLIEAERIIQQAAEVAARAGDVPRARHRVRRQECAIALERGRPRDALRRLETTDEPNEHQRIMLHGDLALWHARLDGPEAAATVVEQVAKGEACADAVGCKRCLGELLLFSAEALARIGREPDARTVLSRWDGLGARDVLDDILRPHAGALAESDPPTRAVALEAALAHAERFGFRLAVLWIRLDLGRALAAAGDERAVAELEALAGVASERGALTVLEFAEHALRALGVRTWRRSAGTGALTEREAEIARLVAAGASNPEIAQQLFLSRKTIERHVSNILRKIGARNRAELAGRVAELEIEGLHR